MKRKVKFLAIMFAFITQSLSIWGTTTDVYSISLNYTPTGRLGNMPKPSKAPANFTAPVSIIHDEGNQSLVMTMLAEGNFTYSIYNEENTIMSQGCVDYVVNNNYTIDLSLYNSGEYRIIVLYNDYTFSGTFFVENQEELQ